MRLAPRHALVVVVCLLLSSSSYAAPKQTDVVIVGAGLAGLESGRQLKKLNISFHILEIAPRLGGRVRTVKYERDGETLYSDSGMEEYWETNPAVAVLKELKLPLSTDVAISSLVLQGQLYPLGKESPTEFKKKVFSTEELAAWDKLRLELVAIVAKLHDRPISAEYLKWKELSFAAWIATKNLPPKISEWIRISIECEIGTEWDKIAALDGMAEMHIFLKDDGEKSVRVLGGNEKFTDALANAIGRKNISLNHGVKSIRTTKEGVEVAYLDMATNKSSKVVAKKVITTIPLYRLFEVQFEPSLSAEKQAAIQSLNWGAYFKAHVFVPKSAERFWTKEGNSLLPILSDSNLGVIYDGNPEQNTKARILSLLITGGQAEAFNMMPQAAARDAIKASFEKLWPGIAKEIQDIEFYRYHPRAIAAWGVGRSRFDAPSEAIRRPENNVHLAGDFTESTHSDGAFLSATRAVKQIREALKGRKVSHE